MKKNKIIKQFNKHYLYYYLKSEMFYSYKILEGIEEKDINDYITNMLWEARKVLSDFKKITKEENQVNLNNEDIKDTVPDYIRYYQLYNFEDIMPYRFIELYHMYCLVSSFELFNDINSLKCRDLYFDTKLELVTEYMDWKRKYPEYEDIFNKLGVVIRESTINEIIRHYPNIWTTAIYAQTEALRDMKVNSIEEEKEEVRPTYNYMFYHLLPKYALTEEEREVLDKISRVMLYELDPFVDEETKEEIKGTADEYLEEKKVKEKSVGRR